ncbi:hypothetical protein ACVWW1_004568 [Bradyrhizobium sp. JR3.5]
MQAITVSVWRRALTAGLTDMDAVSAEIWQSGALTIELASLTTMILLVIGAPLA